jgi:hypothetical protein
MSICGAPGENRVPCPLPRGHNMGRADIPANHTAPDQRPMVAVTWLDSGTHIDHGWASRDTYLKGTDIVRNTVTTVGLLMHKDDESVVVGLTYDPSHDHWYGAQLIALQNVHRIDYLTTKGDPSSNS